MSLESEEPFTWRTGEVVMSSNSIKGECMILKRNLLGAAMLALLLFSVQAFSQATSSISGSVTDATGGVLPGAAVTIANTATGITQKVVANSAGVYSVPGLQVGSYKVTAEMAGFQTQTKTDIRLEAYAQLKLNFELTVASRQDVVEISVATENILLESSSSVGTTLPEEKVSEVPLVGNNVLDLMKVMGGVNMTDSPTFGADRTTFAGISAANVNVQRDGVTVNDVRWATGANSPVFLNQELVGEFKLVIAPVDAEMGRGSGQVQVITKSGANAFHGSGVWNILNSTLDAQQWADNWRGTQTPWRNIHEYTLSLGGPIIKNKTFFFASWDQQIARIREHNINPHVMTPCGMKSIFRYFDGYTNGNFTQNDVPGFAATFPTQTRVVNKDGTPRIGELTQPWYMGANAGKTSELRAISVFGPLIKQIPANDFNCDSVTLDTNGNPTSDWVDYSQPFDPDRIPDTTGYVQRFLKVVPTINNVDVGDGLNWGGFRWVRHEKGIDNVYGLGETPQRKQLSFRIDHNFNSAHRLSGTYSWERNNGEDAQPMWPENSYGGNISREPTSVSISLTSTLKPTLLNEFRFGISRTQSFVVSPLHNTLDNSNEKLKTLLKQLYDPSQIPNWNPDVPIMIGLGNLSAFGANNSFNIANGSNPYGSGRGNFGTYWGGHDPRVIYADTLTWTRGKHSFKFGGEMQRTKSYQEINGSVSFGSSNIVSPYATGGAAVNAPNKGFYTNSQYNPNLPGNMTGTDTYGNITEIQNMLNLYSGSLASVGQYYFINKPTATVYNDVSKGENLKISDYRQNQFSFFFKDDWKLTDDLTLNLGVRYEWYGVPYLAGGMTSGLLDGATSGFGVSGGTFSDWMKAPSYTPDSTPGGGGTSFTYQGAPSQVAFIGPDSPNPGKQLYANDNNNFGPAVGFAWQLPWGGKGKTTLRGGYQMTYMPIGRAAFADAPGVTRDYNYTGTDIGYMSIANLPSLIPVRIPSYMQPPAAAPIAPLNQRQAAVTVYDPGIRTPYVQNLTMSLTRNVGSTLTVDVRYIGTLSRKQMNMVNLNAANFQQNGLFDLFARARRGEDPVELDNMFRGLSLVAPSGGTYAPVGTTNAFGVYQTGAAHLRANTSTRENLADGNFAGVAGSLATMNINTTWNPTLPPSQPYTAGGVLRYNGFPENYIYTNPQYSAVNWNGNLDHANYHSAQVQVTLRPTHGLSLSATYTWSRNLGMLGYMDPTNRAADYGLLNTHRTHAVTTYGTFDLPFGPNRMLFSNVNPNVVGRIIGGWQISWIHTMQTGRPGSFPAITTLYANGTPNRVGDFDPKSAHVSWAPGARTGSYFANQYVNVTDPQCASVTTKDGLRNNCGIVATALASDPTKIIFQNPLPGQRGNWDRSAISTPLTWNTDMSLTKAIRITEGKTFQLRIDATNVFNHAQPTRGSFGSAGSRTVAPGDFFGNITVGSTGHSYWYAPAQPLGYLDSKVGARTFQAKLRFDF